MPPEPDSRSLKTQLSDLRAEIQQCEAFISLCERIKHLEQLDGRETLSSKMSRLENQRTEILGQLESAILEVQQCEQRLNGAGTLQQNQLTAMIKTARGRIGSLQLAAKETTDQLEKLAREMQDNASLLPQLYEQLDNAMKSGQLHPTTIASRLAELRRQEEVLKSQREAVISTRNVPSETSLPRTKGHRPTAAHQGPAVAEGDFRKFFIEDLSKATRSVVIMSRLLAVDQSAAIMPVLARLAASGLNILIYTIAPNQHDREHTKLESQKVLAEAHKALITVIMRNDIEHNAAIIDDRVVWEGSISILGPSQAQGTMHRVEGGNNARQLKQFLFDKEK